MAMELIVETIHKETIKPASPTPLSLKIFKLSLIDLISPPIYSPLIFWYPDAGCKDFSKAKERSQILKKSLSETLAHFFPFAGRIRSNFIECNDEGVDYIEARVNRKLIKQPNAEMMQKLIPIQIEAGEAAMGRVLLVKVNFFECGGMAIGISISHRIADLSTLSTFIKSWSAIAHQEADSSSSHAVLPQVISFSSLFPPMDLPSVVAVEKEFDGEKFPTRRLVFDASKISMLKAKAATTDVPQPTRVEAVTALLWKCASAAATSNRGGRVAKATALSQTVNLRKRMNPPLPGNSIGNLASVFIAKTAAPDSELADQLQVLVQQLRNGIREFSENLVRKLQMGDAVSPILEALQSYPDLLSKTDEVDFYICSSGCRFELYGADFGWGKPRWVSHAGVIMMPNVFALMDSSDGEGIEVWLCLSQAEMGFFERNQELLQFASVNPCVFDVGHPLTSLATSKL